MEWNRSGNGGGEREVRKWLVVWIFVYWWMDDWKLEEKLCLENNW